MSARKRWIIFGAVLVLASILYCAGRYYSPILTQYVVEQSLIQKAPAGRDPLKARERLHALLSAIPDQNARMRKLLQISEYLEKTQHLTAEDLDRLLVPEK